MPEGTSPAAVPPEADLAGDQRPAEEEEPGGRPPLTFTVDLAVIESLGINLYSNAAAVLSELVANAWDADANKVTVDWIVDTLDEEAESSPDGDAGDAVAQIEAAAPDGPTEGSDAGVLAVPETTGEPGTGVVAAATSGIEPPASAGRALKVVIEDDGNGMTHKELNDRFLTVAYKKRAEEGKQSPVLHRPFMGRKGIGKLAVFSLASQVEVFSTKDGERTGFRIRLDDLRAHIAAKKEYRPSPIPVPEDFGPKGTRIVLSDLNNRRTAVTVTALRRRLARRFDVLNFSEKDPARFDIVINKERVTYDDREDLRRVEFIWQLGSGEIDKARTPKVKQGWVMDDNVVDARRDWKIEGWFGTVARPGDLKDPQDKQESLRNIIILARKRPIQEGILDQLDFNQIFGNYVTGQLRAEFLDIDGDEFDDIATSDRQRLIEDDERVKLFVVKLRELFNAAAGQWIEARPRHKFVEMTQRNPVVREWVDTRPESQRAAARKVIETVAALELTDEADRPQLYKSSILAFEKIALDATTKHLELFAEKLTAIDVLPLLATARSYEDALYVQLLRSRLSEIETFERLIDTDEREVVLQKHLFENMWLLEPSWEGATGDADMEISLSRIRKSSGVLFDKTEEGNQKTGRIDIQYRSAAGVHMIVELKKYRRVCSLSELVTQGEKYFEALREVLDKTQAPQRDIKVVFVLGEKPRVDYTGDMTPEEFIESRLSHISGTILYYDEMLQTAQRRYKDYRDRRAEVTELDRVLRALDD